MRRQSTAPPLEHGSTTRPAIHFSFVSLVPMPSRISYLLFFFTTWRIITMAGFPHPHHVLGLAYISRPRWGRRSGCRCGSPTTTVVTASDTSSPPRPGPPPLMPTFPSLKRGREEEAGASWPSWFCWRFRDLGGALVSHDQQNPHAGKRPITARAAPATATATTDGALDELMRLTTNFLFLSFLSLSFSSLHLGFLCLDDPSTFAGFGVG